jgi:serine/threonine protein phosphatase PrpC
MFRTTSVFINQFLKNWVLPNRPLMKFFSNKLQEEQFSDELECLVLASDGLWDVVENEVITFPLFSHSSK